WIVKGSTRRARRTSWIECPEALLLPSADRRTFGVLGVVADFVLIKRVGNHAEPANQAGFALFENNPHASPTRIGAKSTITLPKIGVFDEVLQNPDPTTQALGCAL